MKICIICQNLKTLGGVQRVVIDITKELIDNGYAEVTAIMPDDSIEEGFDLPSGLKIQSLNEVYHSKSKLLWTINRRLPLCDNALLANLLKKNSFRENELIRFAKYLNNQDFDWVIGVSSNYALLVAMMTPLLNAKTAGWMHSTFRAYYETRGHADFGTKALNKKYLCQLQRVYVLNHSDKRRFDTEFGTNSEVLYNPIRYNNTFVAAEKENILLFVGRLNERVKGLSYLMKIIELIMEQNDNFKLVIVGNGKDDILIKKWIKKKKLDEHVEMVGFKKDVGNYYERGKLLLSTSRWEGFGMSIVEAMNYGVPCVAFENDGPNDIINDSMDGILVPKFDVNYFADAVVRCLRDDVYYKIMSYNASKKAISFSMEKFAEQFKESLNRG